MREKKGGVRGRGGWSGKWKREGGEELELQFLYFQGHRGHSSTGDYMTLPMI